MTNIQNSSSSSRGLFGGAITVNLPSSLIDASDLRQIPDNQEVFLSDDSDTSIVVEILGMVEDGAAKTDVWEAAKFHFHSIAHDNSSLSSTLLTPPPPSPLPSLPLTAPSTPTPTTLCGTQVIHKFSHDPSGAPRPGREADRPDDVWVAVGLWRCWLERPGQGKKKADVVLSVNVNLSAEGGEAERARAEGAFEEAVRSLKVVDWGLFGDEE